MWSVLQVSEVSTQEKQRLFFLEKIMYPETDIAQPPSSNSSPIYFNIFYTGKASQCLSACHVKHIYNLTFTIKFTIFIVYRILLCLLVS